MPTTERVGRRSGEATALEIAGFRGQLIGRATPTTTPPEPCGMAPSTGTPG